MMLLWQAPAVLVIVLTWLSAPPTSLADLSRREALRRQLSATTTETLTNDSLPYVPAAGPAVPAAASVETPAEITPPPPAPAAEPEPEPDEVRDEAWWRTRMSSARSGLERDEVLLDAMQTRVNSLQGDIVNRDDPAQRALLQQQLNRALGEMERLTKQIAAGHQAIADIETEARRQNVPPGWIR
jgi:HAMP domain-containing protein